VVGISVITGERVLEFEAPDGAFHHHLQLDEEHLYAVTNGHKVYSIEMRTGFTAGIMCAARNTPMARSRSVMAGL